MYYHAQSNAQSNAPVPAQPQNSFRNMVVVLVEHWEGDYMEKNDPDTDTVGILINHCKYPPVN